ncbi:hypothetical protein Lal_00040478 [Lupinus albus]|nr:hypothetical protein Lal_00040478 [Lupinus albus]
MEAKAPEAVTPPEVSNPPTSTEAPPPRPPSYPPPTTTTTTTKKRPLDSDPLFQNSNYVKIRALVRDLRPHFIEKNHVNWYQGLFFLGKRNGKPTLKALKEVEERLEHRVVEKIEKHIVELAGPENYIELGKGKAKPSLTLAYMKERRVEGLHLHPIELEDEKPEEVVEEMVDFKEYRESYILANTFTSAGTMTMIGNNMKKSLPLFIDSGNIYKCLGVKVAKKLGCLLVTVVDGNKVQMLSSVKNCKWNLHHATSLSDIMVMLLGCWDMPLKIDWLVVLGDTLLGILTH